MHDQGIDRAEPWVRESTGKPRHGVEAEALPEKHRPLVRRHHEIEPHRAKAALLRARDRMRAHRPRDPAVGSGGRGHVAAIRHIGAGGLIFLQIISADDFAAIIGDEHLVCGREPVGERLLPGHLPRQSVGFARANDRLEDTPDRRAVAGGSQPDGEGGGRRLQLEPTPVLQSLTRPFLKPAWNHCMRCADEPWVKESGTT
jgi:hypothetical protein